MGTCLPSLQNQRKWSKVLGPHWEGQVKPGVQATILSAACTGSFFRSPWWGPPNAPLGLHWGGLGKESMPGTAKMVACSIPSFSSPPWWGPNAALEIYQGGLGKRLGCCTARMHLTDGHCCRPNAAHQLPSSPKWSGQYGMEGSSLPTACKLVPKRGNCS